MASPPPRLFVETPLARDNPVSLSLPQVHYVRTVMRRSVGDDIRLFNGQDGEWTAVLNALTRKHATAIPVTQTMPQTSSPDIWLLFAPIKRAPLDQIAQKATELGVSALWPVRTTRSIVTHVKEDRIRANAIEASEQSERLDVPQVKPCATLPQALADWPSERVLFFCNEADTPSFIHQHGKKENNATPLLHAAFNNTAKKAAILIGPEGGFTPQERQHLSTLQFVMPVTLGPRILRADTAAIVALSIWQAASAPLPP